MSSRKYHVPTDQEILDHFILLELGAAGADDCDSRPTKASPRTAAREAKNVVASHHPAVAKGFQRNIGAKAFPRFFIGAALAGATMMAQAGSFACVSGTSNDCALAESTLSWNWNGTDFTIFNSGSGYVSEVYFDLSTGMSASFFGGTGTVSFTAGAHPGALPGGSSVAFTSDASFDSDAPGSVQYGINNGESATFRILTGSLDSIDTGSLAAGVHVRSLTTDAASLVSTPSAVTPVPEPETLAMMLSGFGLIAWATRSRRSRRT
jgi:hypothetical protein